MMGRLLARQGKYAEALVMYLSARRLMVEDGEQVPLVETNARMAECLAWSGRAGEALDLADTVVASAVSVPGAAVQLPLLHRVRAMALASLGRRPEARTAAELSLAAALERDAPHERVWTLDVLSALGEHVDARLIEERDTMAAALGMVALPPAVAGEPPETVVVPDPRRPREDGPTRRSPAASSVSGRAGPPPRRPGE